MTDPTKEQVDACMEEGRAVWLEIEEQGTTTRATALNYRPVATALAKLKAKAKLWEDLWAGADYELGVALDIENGDHGEGAELLRLRKVVAEVAGTGWLLKKNWRNFEVGRYDKEAETTLKVLLDELEALSGD